MRTVTRNNIDFMVVSDTQNNGFWDRDIWGEDDYVLLKKEASNHSVFVHAGGWIGPFTLYAAKLFKHVYCLEPDIAAFDELQRNISLNEYTNVTVENKGFFNKETDLLIGSDHSPLGMSGTSMFQQKDAISITTITLNRFFNDHNIIKNSFLMLDVEGAEYTLFDDVDFFEKFTPTIFVSFHFKVLNDDNFNYLIDSLKKLQHLYSIDIELLINKKETCELAPDYGAIDCLYKVKTK